MASELNDNMKPFKTRPILRLKGSERAAEVPEGTLRHRAGGGRGRSSRSGSRSEDRHGSLCS